MRAERHLADALRAEHEGLPADCVSTDVRGAVVALGELTGRSVTEDLLDAIFSQFCIGK